MIDLDNTIGDREAAVRRWVAEFCAEHQLPDDAAAWIFELDNDGYSSRDEVFVAIRNRYSIEPHLTALVASYRARVVELTEPTTGAIEALHQIKADGHAIAIVTNGGSVPQHAKIEKLGLDSIVDAIVVSGDLDVAKPNPAIFEAAAVATGGDLRDAWMVGDAPVNDIVGGSAVGARTAWLHRGRDWPAVHSPPTLVLDDLRRLPAAINAS